MTITRPMGSFRADCSLKKWTLMNQRNRLFDSYCESLEKLMIWEAKGKDMVLGYHREKFSGGLNKVKALIVKNMEDISAQLVELDTQINDLGMTEPPDELTSQDDHTPQQGD